MLEEHLEWANASYFHSSEGTVNSNYLIFRKPHGIFYYSERNACAAFGRYE